MVRRAGGALAGATALHLTTTGRRTGAPHRVELWFAYDRGCVYLLAHPGPAGKGPDWYRNLVAQPECLVEAGGERRAGRMLPADPAAAAALERRVRERFREKYGPAAYADWYAGTPRLAVAITIEPPGAEPAAGRI